MKYIYRYLCVDLRGLKLIFIIYSFVSEEVGFLLFMREFFILYIYYINLYVYKFCVIIREVFVL